MNGGTLSGGVVIALAAALWLAYLVPTWLRRRDYLNAERNAVRLQQTLRILAETAEAPEEVHVEATAREVARQQKLLKKVQAKADAAARAHAASEARAVARLAASDLTQVDDGPTFPSVSPSRQRAADVRREPDAVADEAGATDGPPVAEPLSDDDARLERNAARSTETSGVGAQGVGARTGAQPSARQGARAGIQAAARAEHDRAFAHAVRRTRLMTTGVVLASIVGIGFGVYSLITAGSWWVLAASAALLVCAVAVLRRLAQQVAAHKAARRTRVEVVRQNPELYDHAMHADPEPVEEVPVDVSWQPQPLPKPMYQSPGSRAAAAMASLDAAVALRRAAARAELDERAARIAAAQVPTIQPAKERPIEQPAAQSAQADASSASVSSAPAAPPKPPSRYARMGMVDDVQSEHIDLDEALRRRRAAG